MRPLEGLTILDLSRLVAGGMLTTVMADFGAEVIKVEQPHTGDPMRSWTKQGDPLWWKVYARNKKSITLKAQRGRPAGVQRGTGDMSAESAGEPVFRTAISHYDRDHIWLRGHEITGLMTGRSFGEVVFLLLTGRLPGEGEAAVFDAMLIASSDHGPNPPSTMASRVIASGNRAAVEAAIAGGILAIGDAHGGAGEGLMRLISESLEKIPDPHAAARHLVQSAVASGRRLPGFGHRIHAVDPRQKALFALARRHGLAGKGVVFVEAVQAELASAGRALPINVDGAIGALLYDLHLPPHLGKIVFIIGRVVGLSAHALEELSRERAMRFHFPFAYDGPQP